MIIASQLGTGIHYISVTCIDSLGCIVQDSMIVGVADLVGLNELDSKLFIYPNPFSDKINFNERVDHIRVYDLRGLEVFHKTESSKSISLMELSNGTYFVEFQFENKKYIKKLIKRNSY